MTHAQQTLGERVSEVKLSKVLRDSPVRLVAPKNDSAKRNMDRIQRLLNQEYEVPQQLLEVNKQHPIIRNLAHKLASNPQSAELVDLAIEQLYESALLQEGLHPSPSSMLPRIQRLLELLTV